MPILPDPRSGRQAPSSVLTSEGEILLVLSGRDDLFSVPELDPFEGHFATASGIERISRKLAALPARGTAPVRLRLVLPQEEVTPTLAADTRCALKAFAAAEREQLAEKRAALARERRQALTVGFVFLAICMAAAAFFDRQGFLPEWLGRLLSEGLVIAGWVALWHPLDLTLYSFWPLRREGRVLDALDAMEVSVEAA